MDQVEMLKSIFEAASYAPIFKENPKYPQTKIKAPYIAFDDVMDYKYIIRCCDVSEISSFRSEKSDEIIAEYSTAEELVNDGWRLD